MKDCMKVEQVKSSEKFYSEKNYRNFLKICVDGETHAEFLDGEPEDGNLSRDYSDCYSIVSLMESAYNAGKNGEEFETVSREIDDWE